MVGINSSSRRSACCSRSQGFTLIISDAEPVSTPGTSVTGEMTTFARVFGGGTYSELIWALVVVIVLQLVLSFTRWGIYTVAVGGNRHGAAEAGIRVRLVIIRNFILCAALAGLVGVLEAVRTTSVQPDPSGANSVLFDGISAAVIGGTLLAGGSGTVVGGADRSAAARHPQRWPHHQGRQRRLPELLPRPGDHHRDGRQHVRRPSQDGGRAVADEVLRVEHITKRFGPVVALRDINLQPAQGRGARACSATTAPASRR